MNNSTPPEQKECKRCGENHEERDLINGAVDELLTPPVEALELRKYAIKAWVGSDGGTQTKMDVVQLSIAERVLQTEITRAVVNELETEVLRSLVGLGEPKSITVIWQRIAQLKGGGDVQS